MATTLVRYRKFAAAAEVLTSREGIIQATHFNWFEEDELKDIYAKAGYSILSTRGTGTLSSRWIDGLTGVVSPNEVTSEERAELLRLERLAVVPFRNMARYLLVVAEPLLRHPRESRAEYQESTAGSLSSKRWTGRADAACACPAPRPLLNPVPDPPTRPCCGLLALLPCVRGGVLRP